MKLFFLFFIFVGSVVQSFAKEQNQAVIFMYHRFGESRYPSTSIKMEQFAFELEYLKKHHYNVLPLSKIVQILRNGQDLPQKTVALTMDDAYKSVYTKAYPLLKKYGFPFTVFVNSEPVDKHYGDFMTWEQMREMAAFGAEFGNHSMTHPSFVSFLSLGSKKMQEMIKKELDGAKKRLKKELGSAYVDIVAYPFGEYTNAIRDHVASLGYVACAQMGGVLTSQTNLAEIPRFPMSERFATKKGFLLKLRTKALPLAEMPQEDHLVRENPPHLVLHLKKHLDNIGCFVASGKRASIKWLDATHVQIEANSLLKPPRDHYTCTALDRDGRWQWYSFFWVFQK
ncbi:Polysaccharide deacetylase family protein [hydrothermal vent metagenome]|uniref:Polysaccharide deacetylase family protein n=1 Tax=hydrothermal vent metagenome TaxID=652676 RepID=A0A1W1BFR1_9ZZZZ